MKGHYTNWCMVYTMQWWHHYTMCFPASGVFFPRHPIAWRDKGCFCELHGWSLYMHKIRLCSMQWYATLDCNISNIACTHKNVKIGVINEARWGGSGGDHFPWRRGKCRDERVWPIFSKKHTRTRIWDKAAGYHFRGSQADDWCQWHQDWCFGF